jgi:tryptophanyl-tRNA synthetase
MRAVTDAGPTQENQEKPEAVQNLFDLMNVVSTPDTVQHFDNLYNKAEIRYGDFKKQLAEDMIIATSDVRARINEINQDDAYIAKVLKLGAEKAQASAQKTMKEVREIIGLKKLY